MTSSYLNQPLRTEAEFKAQRHASRLRALFAKLDDGFANLKQDIRCHAMYADYHGAYTPRTNIREAFKILREELTSNGGDWDKALYWLEIECRGIHEREEEDWSSLRSRNLNTPLSCM